MGVGLPPARTSTTLSMSGPAPGRDYHHHSPLTPNADLRPFERGCRTLPLRRPWNPPAFSGAGSYSGMMVGWDGGSKGLFVVAILGASEGVEGQGHGHQEGAGEGDAHECEAKVSRGFLYVTHYERTYGITQPD